MSGSRVALNTGFIQILQVNLRISRIDLVLLDKGLSGLFILTIGPESGNFTGEASLMKPTDDHNVADLYGKLICEVAVKFLGGPAGLPGQLGVPYEIYV